MVVKIYSEWWVGKGQKGQSFHAGSESDPFEPSSSCSYNLFAAKGHTCTLTVSHTTYAHNFIHTFLSRTWYSATQVCDTNMQAIKCVVVGDG